MSVLPNFRTRFIGLAHFGLRHLSTPKPSGLQLDDGSPLPFPSDEVVSPKISALVDEICNLSLLEVADLNRVLKKRLNIADQVMMPPSITTAAHSPSVASAEAKSDDSSTGAPQKMTFGVKLTKFDDSKKIALIKEIRATIPGLNLVQAKKFVESAPVVVKEDMGKSEAEEMKVALEKAGATVEIV